MAGFTEKDMQETLDLFRNNWTIGLPSEQQSEEKMDVIEGIVIAFVANARINQVARFAVWLHRDIEPVASIYFCNRLADFV